MPTNLQPLSQISAIVLPATGSSSEVTSSLAYGIYSTAAFVSGAVDQVAYTYNKLGGKILDLEITTTNVYNAYEEACLEYSYLINTHQSKNVLSDLMGNTTGSFDEDGEFIKTPQLSAPGIVDGIGEDVVMHEEAISAIVDAVSSMSRRQRFLDDKLESVVSRAARRVFRAETGKRPIVQVHVVRI